MTTPKTLTLLTQIETLNILKETGLNARIGGRNRTNAEAIKIMSSSNFTPGRLFKVFHKENGNINRLFIDL